MHLNIQVLDLSVFRYEICLMLWNNVFVRVSSVFIVFKRNVRLCEKCLRLMSADLQKCVIIFIYSFYSNGTKKNTMTYDFSFYFWHIHFLIHIKFNPRDSRSALFWQLNKLTSLATKNTNQENNIPKVFGINKSMISDHFAPS